MATYVISDIHGHYDKYIEMLKKIELRDDDTLYILGDLVDRGPQGLALLLDIIERPNVVALIGNHDFTAAYCLRFLLNEVTEEATDDEDRLMKQLGAVEGWLNDGGKATLDEFNAMSPDDHAAVVEAFGELELYAEDEVGDREFVMVHAGLAVFDPNRPLEDYSPYDLFTVRSDPNAEYFEDRYLIVGHTPTRNICGEDRIFINGRFIDIDCGCGWGGRLGCLRLDDFAEFYV